MNAPHIIETIHVLTPDDMYVTEEVIIGWARERMIEGASPTLEEAKAWLTDLGSHTFAEPVFTNRVSVNRMSDVLRPLGRACYPKEQHATQGAAEAQVRSITKRGLEKSDTIHVYQCPHCESWHVGHRRIA